MKQQEHARPPLADVFGIRSAAQLASDVRTVIRRMGGGFQFDLSSLKHLRPDLSLRAYAGGVPTDGHTRIMNFFDRVGGGRYYSQRVTKRRCQDYRSGRLTYDEHDGTDFVCPVATPIVAAAPGQVTLIRDRWLRGGLTMTVDHGAGLATQYTHLSRALLCVGDKVCRGETIALSGASGMDMTTFFPWVPPHLHFMVWHLGRPVDPFLADDEPDRAGTWTRRNAPEPGDEGDGSFPEPRVDLDTALTLAKTCTDSSIRREIEAVRDLPLSLVALLEDSFHHDSFAWPHAHHELRTDSAEPLALSLPLTATRYRGAIAADAWNSEPSVA